MHTLTPEIERVQVRQSNQGSGEAGSAAVTDFVHCKLKKSVTIGCCNAWVECCTALLCKWIGRDVVHIGNGLACTHRCHEPLKPLALTPDIEGVQLRALLEGLDQAADAGVTDLVVWGVTHR